MSSVSRYIRQQSESTFEGSWMMVVEWKDVPEYQSDIDKVCAIIQFQTTKPIFVNSTDNHHYYTDKLISGCSHYQ